MREKDRSSETGGGEKGGRGKRDYRERICTGNAEEKEFVILFAFHFLLAGHCRCGIQQASSVWTHSLDTMESC